MQARFWCFCISPAVSLSRKQHNGHSGNYLSIVGNCLQWRICISSWWCIAHGRPCTQSSISSEHLPHIITGTHLQTSKNSDVIFIKVYQPGIVLTQAAKCSFQSSCQCFASFATELAVVVLLLLLDRARRSRGSATQHNCQFASRQMLETVAIRQTSMGVNSPLMSNASRRQGPIRNHALKVSCSLSYVVRTTLWNLI